MNKQFHFILFGLAIFSCNWCSAVPVPNPVQENTQLREDETSGRQIQNILDIPQQVASFIGNALFPTTPTTTTRATTIAPTPRISSRNRTPKPNTESNVVNLATPAATPRIKYVYVTPPPPRVVIVKPRPFAPAVAQPAATQAPVPVTETEPVTEAVEGGDEDEDTEEEGI